ncbi:hypothetical protein CSC94_17570 [Zhengella mangrovi]|uniref:Sulfatase N-terminal domain-containing protein n=1 Tax=Zhengella mangrovi TaxID=1982044 RepID=A0A2G1QJD6_9HYPH|nr:LTA synthase family protein [Zhengella mangrovi]PHP65657.1 hypothetical protein CSC94_17570 [Zhengella mangrovi]
MTIPVVLVLAALSAYPLVFRLLHMDETGLPLRHYDHVGIASDLAVGLMVSVLLILFARKTRFAWVVASGVWVVLNVVNYEFLREFGSTSFAVEAAQVLEPVFMAGSGTNIHHAWLAAALFAGLVGSLAVIRRKPDAGQWQRIAGVAFLCLLAVELYPRNINVVEWRQRDFVVTNLRDLFERMTRPAVALDAALLHSPQVEAVFQADLDGMPLFGPAQKRAKNVLLVFMEGASGAFVPSVAAVHGIDSRNKMTRLDEIARANITYTQFITAQRKSDRGIYSALCGDLPTLTYTTPKMSQIANGKDSACLPGLLASAGYSTLFMKSANISYMQMDTFARKAGYERAYGNKGFDPSLPRQQWGVSDEILYSAAFDEINALEKSGKPWFVTLFTSSTHHPFNIPDSFTGMPDEIPRIRSWAYADKAVGDFVDRLRSSGKLDDTLVLITADEASLGLANRRDKEESLHGLTENWGVMVAVSPDRTPLRIDDTFQQADISLSILDYLGLDRMAGGFLGRSMFRRYAHPRNLYFANNYKHAFYELDTARRLTTCDDHLKDCVATTRPDLPLFSSAFEHANGPAEASERMIAVQARSLGIRSRPARETN